MPLGGPDRGRRTGPGPNWTPIRRGYPVEIGFHRSILALEPRCNVPSEQVETATCCVPVREPVVAEQKAPESARPVKKLLDMLNGPISRSSDARRSP